MASPLPPSSSSSSSPPSSPLSSAFSSSPSLSSFRSKNTRPRTLPRRGQIKAAIFASIFTSIARFLGAHSPAQGDNGAHSSPSGPGSHARISDFSIHVGSEGSEGFSAEDLKSSSGAHVPPNSSFGLLSLARPSSFVDGTQQIG